MEVRHPEPDDAAAVRAAWARAWRAGHGDVVSDAVLAQVPVEPGDGDVKRWRERLAEWRDRTLVAADDGAVGFVQVRLEETKPFVGDGEAGLKELYVHPDRWGEGVGSALLAAAIDRLPPDVDTIRLEMLAGNDRAAAFYEARGFERTGEVTVDVGGEDYPGLIYTRRLG